jgi:hypothetical protein
MFYPRGGKELTIGYEDDTLMKVHLPPEGMVWNYHTKQVEYSDIIKRSEIKEEQYWEAPKLPANYRYKRHLEKKAQEIDESYVDIELEEFRKREWKRRLYGVWFWNNGELCFITGTYYLFLTYWILDDGLPEFRIPDRDFFYAWGANEENPDSAGIVLLTKRRQGKTAKSGVIMYDRTSKTRRARGGIQSKTEDDAKEIVFFNGVVMPFLYMVDFFVPKFDKGREWPPKDQIRFFAQGSRGKDTEAEFLDYDDPKYLESWIDYKNSKEKAYDGSKLFTYVGDEIAKCLVKDTKVRMFNGEVKKVQDVTEGEFLMGIDSNPREVTSVAQGKETCYNIIPNKGEVWGCNESHILSLKYCRSERPVIINGKKYYKEDTVNVSVKDYLTLPIGAKKHLMLYKVGVDYPAKVHEMDPYMLGLWLGDGTSSTFNFTVNDYEIKDYLKNYAQSTGNHYKEWSSPNRTATITIHKPSDLKNKTKLFNMNELGLFKNKHIPKEYMIDSRENRLKLLAGLIDTDGCRPKDDKKRMYTIVQKKKVLALNIKELALSLGFYASMNETMATMKRIDGSMYSCLVYRVSIFGENLDDIPCLILRKKYAPLLCKNKNARNPLRTGFSVKISNETDYYGFTINGDHLFLLADYTVTHNTSNVDVHKRHYLVRKTLLARDGFTITGKMLYTTTVEDMDAGSDQFRTLWQESDQSKVTNGNRTKSWLYRWFVPAQKTIFYNKYGYNDEAKALEFFQKERDNLKDSPHALAKEIRQNPFHWKEAFRSDGDSCLYNPLILDNRQEELMWKKKLVRRGELMWVDNTTKREVKFVENPNGRFYVYMEPDTPNDVKWLMGGAPKPNGTLKHVIGCDPFDHVRTKSGTFSLGAAAVYKRHDSLNSDGDNFACIYLGRPLHPYIFYEEMVMLCHWYGCQMLFEDQKTAIRHYFEMDRKYHEFLVRNDKNEVGISASVKSHLELIEETGIYITDNGHRCPFHQQISDWKDFDPDDTEKFDLAMASGYALIANSRMRRKNEKRMSKSKMDVKSFMRL